MFYNNGRNVKRKNTIVILIAFTKMYIQVFASQPSVAMLNYLLQFKQSKTIRLTTALT